MVAIRGTEAVSWALALVAALAQSAVALESSTMEAAPSFAFAGPGNHLFPQSLGEIDDGEEDEGELEELQRVARGGNSLEHFLVRPGRAVSLGNNFLARASRSPGHLGGNFLARASKRNVNQFLSRPGKRDFSDHFMARASKRDFGGNFLARASKRAMADFLARPGKRDLGGNFLARASKRSMADFLSRPGKRSRRSIGGNFLARASKRDLRSRFLERASRSDIQALLKRLSSGGFSNILEKLQKRKWTPPATADRGSAGNYATNPRGRRGVTDFLARPGKRSMNVEEDELSTAEKRSGSSRDTEAEDAMVRPRRVLVDNLFARSTRGGDALFDVDDDEDEDLETFLDSINRWRYKREPEAD